MQIEKPIVLEVYSDDISDEVYEQFHSEFSNQEGYTVEFDEYTPTLRGMLVSMAIDNGYTKKDLNEVTHIKYINRF